jgi:cell division septation protein DedD
MNSLKLREKLTKILGCLENDKSLLFNNFISKLFELLKPGERIKVNELGYFNKINYSIVSNSNLNPYESAKTLESIIVFSPSENLGDYFTEEQILFEPTKFETHFNSVENLFSISAGRDILSTELVNSGQIIIPTSQSEYQDLLNSKLENLISKSTVSKISISEIPCLKLDVENGMKEFVFDNSNQHITYDKTDTNKTIEFTSNDEIIKDQSFQLPEIFSEKFNNTELVENTDTKEEIIDNDIFDENLTPSQDTIEHEILSDDVINTQHVIEISETEKSDTIFNELLNLNGFSSYTDDDSQSEAEESKLTDEFSVQKKNNLHYSFDDEIEVPSEEISWDKIISEIDYDEEEINYESSSALIEEVTSPVIDQVTTKDEQIELSNAVSEIELSDDNDDITKDELIDNVITEIKSEDSETSFKKNEFTFDEEIATDTDDEEEDSFDTSEQSITGFDSDIEAESDFDVENISEELQEIQQKSEDYQSEKDSMREEFAGKSMTKKSNWLWIVAFLFVVIISTGVTYYLYPQYFTFFQKKQLVVKSIISDKDVTIIERDFKIPVTFPYPQNEKLSGEEKINIQTKPETSLIEKSSETQTVDKKNENVIKPTENNQKMIITSEKKIQRITETISKIDNSYIVQVASFKSKQVAEKEVNRIKSKGYQAFVEQTEIPNRGIWYRVKVGGFKSETEAINFQSSYK